MPDDFIVPDTGYTLSAGRKELPLLDGVFSGLVQAKQSVRRSVAAGTVNGGRAVLLNASGEAEHADAGTLAHAGRVCGVARDAALVGEGLDIVESGLMDDVAWTWTPGLPIFLGAAGMLTQVEPATPGCVFSCIVGRAITATRLQVAVQAPVILA